MFESRIKRIKAIPAKLNKAVLVSLKAHEKQVLDYITKIQLFEKGEDGQGISLGEYTPFTIEIKKAKGQRTDHITLRDKGTFHKSYKLTIDGLVTADAQKEDTNLVTEFGADILVLSDKGQDVMIKSFVREDLQNLLRKQIC